MAKKKAPPAQPPPPPPPPRKGAAEAKRLADIERSRDRTRQGSDIGEIPPIVNPERRESCRNDLQRFLEVYFPNSTGLSPFSDDHIRVVKRIEGCIIGGGRFCNAVYRGFAKALDISTPIPTPSGFVPMGDLAVGDTVLDESGKTCRITAATGVMRGTDCYSVEFDDGESIVCSGDHLWTVNDGATRRKTTIDTRVLFSEQAFVPANRKHRFSVDVAGVASMAMSPPESVSPYVLGYWLGDGHSASNRITIGPQDEDESKSLIESEGESVTPSGRMLFTVGKGRAGTTARHAKAAVAVAAIDRGATARQAADEAGISYRSACGIKYLNRWRGGSSKPSLSARLREIGVLNNKHIPAAYLFGPTADRWAILQGLMDTDGTVSKSGHCSFCNKSRRLVEGLRVLLWSLGIKNTMCAVSVSGAQYFKVHFTAFADRPCFRLKRKVARLRTRPPKPISGTRRIVSVRRVESRPVRCIEVDSPNRLYLCGRSFVPTHNSTISENAVLWATLYGHRHYCAIFAGEGKLADRASNSVKMELSDNELLYEDFPEVCHPVRALEGKTQRCASQTFRGEKTHIKWQADITVMPTIPGSASSGSIIQSRGLTGSILGLRHKAPDGRQLRPDFVIVDDPQTRESAASPLQCAKRLEILTKSVLKLAGHTTSIACVVNATVIQHDDMVDQLLDQKKFPAWQGERIPMIRQWADAHEDFWLSRYRDLRNTFDKDIPGDQARAHQEANELYLANREMADAGCRVSWLSCFDPEREYSAIQHAYNALIDDGPDVFASEFQNQPLPNEAQSRAISSDDVRQRVIQVPRWIVPRGLDTLTAFVDVQEKLLYWAIVAWGPQLRGHTVAYGAYPDQGRAYFSLRDARKTLVKAAGGVSLEAAIYAGLEAVSQMLLDREFSRESDDAVLRVQQLFIDANWAQTAGVVRDFARRSQWGPRVLPTHGRFVGASGSTLSDKKAERGERVGANWRTSTIHRQRHILFDTNAWKTFFAARCKLPAADPQSFTLHSGDHSMLTEQLTSEYPTRVEAKARVVDEWRLIPGRDNHLLDCMVGAAVAASYSGVSAVGTEARAGGPVTRQAISREEMAAKREELLRRMGRA